MTKYNIGIRQAETETNFYLSPYQKKHFTWRNYKKPRFINLTLHENDVVFQNSLINWNFSQDIDITLLGVTNVVLRQKGNSFIKKYFKFEIINQQGIIYIIVEEYQDLYGPFLIKNSLEKVSICYKQEITFKKELFPFDCLKPKTESVFCWDFPLGEKTLLVDFISEDYEKMDMPLKLSSLNDINESYQIVLLNRDSKNPPLVIIVIIKLFKEMKIFEFLDAETRNIKTELEVLSSNEMNPLSNPLSIKLIFKLQQIGLSFIQNSCFPTNELLFVAFKGCEFIALDKNRVRTYQIRLKSFAINNNSSDIVRFPVVLSMADKGVMEKEKFLMNMIFKKHIDIKEIAIFDTFRFEMEPLKIKIERVLLDKIIEYIDIISQILSKSSSSFQSDLFQQQGKYLYKLNKNEKPVNWDWENEEIEVSHNQIYFKEIVIAPFTFNLTFVNNQYQNSEFKLNPLSMLLNSMLSTIANLEDVKIKLKGLHLVNCNDTKEGIITKFEAHYRQNLVKELFTTIKIFNMLGHADFVGNPIGLFQNISTGVTDLIEKPLEGIVKGPLEGGKGLFQGAGSLAKNTFKGTFNTVKVITGSLSSGIASLSQDKEYLQEREQMKNKEVKHVGEGLEQGAKSIFKGFEKGLTGFFKKPIEGSKKDGALGFFTGAVQGITGLIVKPITGVLDAASKTAEGVKNTASIFDNSENEGRERDPRVFYGYDRFYGEYNIDDVEIMRILKKTKKGKFANNHYYGFKKYLITSNEPNNFYFMIFTLEELLNYSIVKKKFEWYLKVSNFKSVEKNGGGMKILFKEKDKKMKIEELWIKIENEVVLNAIIGKVQFLIETQSFFQQI